MTNMKLSCAFGLLAILVAGCGEREAESAPAKSASAPVQSAEPVEHADTATDEDSVAISDSQPGNSRLGPALDEPERYFGVYALPDRPARGWFIAEAKRPAYAERAPEVPPGHLMLGAMFGDVAPWQMKTISEDQFEQAQMNPGQTEPVAIEFRFDTDGRATAFRFTGGVTGYDPWLERTGDLPEGW